MQEEIQNDNHPDFEGIDWDSELEKIDAQRIIEEMEIERCLETELAKIEDLLTRWLGLPHDLESTLQDADDETLKACSGRGVGQFVVHQYSQWVCENFGFDYDSLEDENKTVLSTLLLNCIRQGVAIGIGMKD